MPRTRALMNAGIAFALLLSMGSLATRPASAQDAGMPGDAVQVTNAEGDALGSLAVVDITDPYTEFDPASPAEPGSRYVALNVAADADAGARFDIEPQAVVLQDNAGFLWDRTSFVVPDDAVIPELSSDTLAPGSRVSGLVVFALPNESTPARVFYQPDNSRLVDLADVSNEPAPAIGDAIPIFDSEGGSGSVTVTEIADPFEAFDPTQPPPVDARFVLVTVAFENNGEGRFFIEPFGLTLRDADGNLWSSTNVPRVDETELVPDLNRTQLAPGDRLSGVVGFAVPENAELDGVYAAPTSGQLVLLADVNADSESPAGEPAATPTTGLDDETAAALSDACLDVEQWVLTARERIAVLKGIDFENVTLEDVAMLAEQAPRYAELAQAQLEEDSPEAVAAVNAALAAAFGEYAAAVDQIQGAVDPGNDPIQEIAEALQSLDDANEQLQEVETDVASIASECGLSDHDAP